MSKFLLVFLGAFCACLAYFFLDSDLYSLFSITGGILLLSPLVFRIRDAFFYALRTTYFKILVFAIVYSFLILAFQYVFDSSLLILREIYAFLLVAFFSLSGFVLSGNPKSLSKLFVLYGALVSIVGFYIMTLKGVGFEITAQYAVSGKNAICVTWAISAALIFWVLVWGIGSRVLRIIGGAVFSFLSICILYARGRTAFVALCVFCLILIFKRFSKGKATYLVPLIFLLAVLILVISQTDLLPQVLKDSFFANKDSSDLNSITSGRIELLSFAFDAIKTNPIMGVGNAIFSADSMGTDIHNYPIRIIATYGIIGGLGILLFYSYMCVLVLRKFFEKKKPDFFDVGVYVSALLLVVSMGEPTQPLGPGTITAIAYIFLSFSTKGMKPLSNSPYFERTSSALVDRLARNPKPNGNSDLGNVRRERIRSKPLGNRRCLDRRDFRNNEAGISPIPRRQVKFL